MLIDKQMYSIVQCIVVGKVSMIGLGIVKGKIEREIRFEVSCKIVEYTDYQRL